MKKTDSINNSNTIQSKILSIVLILLLTFLSYNLLPKRFEDLGGIFNFTISMFTIFFSGYVFQYGLKKIISKIFFAVLILITISNLILYAYILQL
ncbi:hypothetical protein HYN86_07570 [Flavobacterium fluviale]|uniref:Uncharacterized protein n=1 Tax=Flavobacterium fluviale TaxID=2249356 RepID=A0A344LRC9_9FLAO|nr:hypothetical protein HYN86_07570 [Flavobacterium fluviale]